MTVQDYRPDNCWEHCSTTKNVLSFVYFLCKAVKLLLDSVLLTNECTCTSETRASLSHTHTTPTLTPYPGSKHTKPNHNPGCYTLLWFTSSKGLYKHKTWTILQVLHIIILLYIFCSVMTLSNNASGFWDSLIIWSELYQMQNEGNAKKNASSNSYTCIYAFVWNGLCTKNCTHVKALTALNCYTLVPWKWLQSHCFQTKPRVLTVLKRPNTTLEQTKSQPWIRNSPMVLDMHQDD